jgi:hypothetical protein
MRMRRDFQARAMVPTTGNVDVLKLLGCMKKKSNEDATRLPSAREGSKRITEDVGYPEVV